MKRILAKYKLCSAIFVFHLCFQPLSVFSEELVDVLVTDVSAKAFSVVWASSERVLDAGAAIFHDPEGTQPVHSAEVVTVSRNVASAHEQGLAKLRITGLKADSTYYIQIENSTPNGSGRYPLHPPYLKTRTAIQATATLDGQPVVNELMTYEMISPDPLQSSRGRLVVVDVPGAVLSPLSGFVGEFSGDERSAVIDLNNLLSLNGQRYEISQVEKQVVAITELRGFRACEGLKNHKQIHYSFAPKDQNIPKVSKLSSAERCAQGDINCDQVVDDADLARLVSALGSTKGDCLFNNHLDIIPDGMIDSYDHEKLTTLRSQ